MRRSVLRHSPRGKMGFITRVNLFNFGAHDGQPKLVTDLEGVCKERGIILGSRVYSPASFTYGAECRTVGARTMAKRNIVVFQTDFLGAHTTWPSTAFAPRPSIRQTLFLMATPSYGLI